MYNANELEWVGRIRSSFERKAMLHAARSRWKGFLHDGDAFFVVVVVVVVLDQDHIILRTDTQ